MSRLSRRTSGLTLTCVLFWVFSAGFAVAQDIEPRRWTNMPVGTNVLGVGQVYTIGDLNVDPTLQLEDADVEMHTTVVSYNHYFSLFGKTARVDALLPFQSGRWKGRLAGVKESVRREGLADPRLRLSVNLVGAPALSREEFREYRKEHSVDTTVGTAVAVNFPLGQYKDDKLINLGQNRFTIRPQLGVLHTRGPWSFELSGSIFFFTDNDDFFDGKRLEQDPLYGMQGHVVRTFASTYWVAAGLSYGVGGESEIDGEGKDDSKSILLYGASFGLSITGAQGVRVGYVRRETLEDTGIDSHSFLVSWAARF